MILHVLIRKHTIGFLRSLSNNIYVQITGTTAIDVQIELYFPENLKVKHIVLNDYMKYRIIKTIQHKPNAFVKAYRK